MTNRPTKLTLIIQSDKEPETAGKLVLSYKSNNDLGECVRRALPMLLARGKFEGEQLELPFGFEILKPDFKQYPGVAISND